MKLKLGILLFVLGLIGILSMLTMEVYLPPEAEKELLEQFSKGAIKWLVLVNPTIMLVLSTFVGTLLHDKLNFKILILKRIVGSKEEFEIVPIIKYGIIGGLFTGLVLVATSVLYTPFLPNEFQELSAKVQASLAARFLYGGFTEELLLRFGLMTFIVFLGWQITRSQKPKIYWIGILISAVLFGMGHLPIVFQALDSPSLLLISYVIIGNTLGGIVFGWLYWKKGLESAFIAHIVTHVVMVVLEALVA